MRITHSFLKKNLEKKKGLGRSHHSPGVWLQGISVLYGSGLRDLCVWVDGVGVFLKFHFLRSHKGGMR